MTEDPKRRDVLRSLGGVTAGLAATLGPNPTGQSLPTESLSGHPDPDEADREAEQVFPQGVAAGDPTSEGVVLWTRIAPEAYTSSAPLTLQLTAVEGADRLGPLRSVDTDPLPEQDYTVKVDLDGHLDPGREYYYQFVYDDVHGPVGRCRTLPAPDSSPERVRFGVVTCQNFKTGYYGAFSHLADDDLDYLVHLGDFIYEYGGSGDYDDRGIDLPSGNRIAWGLEDFRHLYRRYRSDRFLQEALASYAMIATWDDHEIVNNRYWDYDADRPWSPSHPQNDDAGFMRQLFADGIQAWWEYMPVRVRYDPDADHLHDQLRLWRSFQFGDLVNLLITDERLFRSLPDENPTIDLSENAIADPASVDLDHTMLGKAQREWFTDTITDHPTTWTAWGNEVVNMHLDTEYQGEKQYENSDAWDGYETERRLIMRYLDDNDIGNFVALTGDLHTALAGHLRIEYDGSTDLDGRVGVELMTPALSSPNLAEFKNIENNFLVKNAVKQYLLSNNPHLKLFDSFHHGYAVVEFTPEACDYTVYAVDKTVDSADASKQELAAFRVPEGEPRLQRR